jgi:hypothetical protein
MSASRSWIVTVGILSVVAASCSSSSSKATESSTTQGSTPATTVKSSQNIAADQTAAQAASLKLSDFPSGWTSQPQSNNTPGQGVKNQLAQCLGVSPSQLTQAPAEYDSPDFSDSNNNTATSDVDYRATAAEQRTAFALFSSPKTPGCLTTAVQAVINDAIKHPTNPSDTLPSDAKLGAATVSPMSFPQFGDSSVAYQVKVPVSYKGLDITVYLDDIFSIKGRAGVDMTFEAVLQPFASDQEQHYTSLVVGRLTNTT